MRQTIRCRVLFVCLCVVFAAACQKTPQTGTQEATTPAADPPGVPASELAPRRDRAGLDLGERSDRPSAAQLIPAAPVSNAPPLQEGEDAQRSKDAMSFVHSRWLQAITGEDEAAYKALLHPDFKGMIPGEELPVNAIRWISIGAMTAHQPKVLGPVEVHPMPGPLGRITVSFHTLQATGACAVVARELTLQPHSDVGLQVMVSSLGAPVPCLSSRGGPDAGGQEAPEHQARLAHSALKASWLAGDKEETLRSLSPPVSVREHGREVASYDAEAVMEPAGRWLLDELKDTEATAVTIVPPWALISDAGQGSFVYRWSGERWKLVVRYRTAVTGI